MWLLVLVVFVMNFAGTAIPPKERIEGDANAILIGMALLSSILDWKLLTWGSKFWASADPVSAMWIDDDYVWFNGVHPDYLESLPPWLVPFPST